MAPLQEFLQTKPSVIDLEEVNKTIYMWGRKNAQVAFHLKQPNLQELSDESQVLKNKDNNFGVILKTLQCDILQE